MSTCIWLWVKDQTVTATGIAQTSPKSTVKLKSASQLPYISVGFIRFCMTLHEPTVYSSLRLPKRQDQALWLPRQAR